MSTTGHETEAINVQGLKASLKKGGNKGIYNEAICSTAGATAAKVTNTTPPSFSLVSGAKIIVKFTYTISVANATLQVGSTAAKPIYLKGAALAANVVKAGTSLLLAYDGTAFNIIGGIGGNETDISYDTTNKKLTKTIDEVQSDVVTAATIVEDGGGIEVEIGETSPVGNPKLFVDEDADPAVTLDVYTRQETDSLLDDKQDTLVSGTNIKTINSQSILGSGNIDIQGGSSTDISYDITNKKITKTIDGTTTDVVTASTLVKDGNADLLDGYTVIDTWGTSAEHYDLNNLTTTGVYVMTDSTKKDYFDNKAYDDIFVLKVSTNAEGNAVQRFIRPNSNAYQRRFTNGAFGSWNLIEKSLPANMASASTTDHVVISEDWHGKATDSDSPSSVGWYRIGRVGAVFDVIVRQMFTNTPGTSFRIFGAITDGSGSDATWIITQIGGAGNANIDKVRVAFESNESYLEFHYNTTNANDVFWKFLQGTPYDTIQTGGGTPVKNINLGDVGTGVMLASADSNGKLTRRLVLNDDYTIATGALTINAKEINVIKYDLTGNISGVTINNLANGQQLFVIFYASSARTVTIAHNDTYKCAKGEDVSLSIPAGGNRVVCFTKNYGKIYVSVFANV